MFNFRTTSITKPDCKITMKHGLRYRVINGITNRASRRAADARQLKDLPNPRRGMSRVVRAAQDSRIGLNKPSGLISTYFRNLGIERNLAA